MIVYERKMLCKKVMKIQVYDNQPIRTAWDEQNEEWYFSIVDVVSVLTDQPDRRRAWKVLECFKDST